MANPSFYQFNASDLAELKQGIDDIKGKVAELKRRAGPSPRQIRSQLLQHRRKLATAIFQIYFEAGSRGRARGWSTVSIRDALAILEASTPSDEAGRMQRNAAELFTTLAHEQLQGTGRPQSELEKVAPHKTIRELDLYPFAIINSTAENNNADNETNARLDMLINMDDKPSDNQRFLHVARAVDPRAWIETGYFRNMYRVEWDKHGVPTYDDDGQPRRHAGRDEETLGGPWDQTGYPGTDVDLVFEDFDIENINREPLGSYRNIFAIERFSRDDEHCEFRWRLFRSLDSTLLGLPQDGGMDKNEGRVRADKATWESIAKAFSPLANDWAELVQLTQMKSKAAKDLRNKIYNTFEKLKAKERSPATAPVESCVPERSLETPEPVGFHQLKAVSVPTEDSTGDSLHESSYAGPRDSGAAAEDTSNDASEESSGAAPEGFNVADLVKTTDISSCLLIKARKTVHFSDLTKQGESPIDAGELLNYANPFVLKPIFEILLVLGVAARQNGNDVGPLNQLVKLRGAEQNGVH